MATPAVVTICDATSRGERVQSIKPELATEVRSSSCRWPAGSWRVAPFPGCRAFWARISRC